MVSHGGTLGMQQCAKPGILARMVLRLGMAILATRSVCVATSSQHKGVMMRIESHASKHLMSDIYLLHSFDECDVNISFSFVARTRITPRTVGTVKFETTDARGDFRIITLENMNYVPQQQHNLVAVTS